ncbi:hypothetical protein LPU83_pLPU83d_0007 (plasmid) [Rhizobium favelukesii]|uniref:GFA family protein n=1 Tax=Rhizobium favelukesii TaxID=348824 RepID=W6RRB2_9HYPH|nr:hypothetical protein LPU83_pLPU83d_0007 [Rhizobium favelukesii]
MTKTYSGGCACGAIRYETSSEPTSQFPAKQTPGG